MWCSRYVGSYAVLVPGILALGMTAAFAQPGRTWVDPPADLGTAPAPQAVAPASPAPPVEAPSPPQAPPTVAAPPARAAQARASREERLAARSEAARELIDGYLEAWSAPNGEAIEATEKFYGPRVLFHGRTMSMQELLREKRRFAQRWPERDYRLRPDSMQVACNPAATVCTVHSVFGFAAANPDRGQRTQGVAALRLVLSFAGEQPVIAVENSMVLARGPAMPGAPAREDMSDE